MDPITRNDIYVFLLSVSTPPLCPTPDVIFHSLYELVFDKCWKNLHNCEACLVWLGVRPDYVCSRFVCTAIVSAQFNNNSNKIEQNSYNSDAESSSLIALYFYYYIVAESMFGCIIIVAASRANFTFLNSQFAVCLCALEKVSIEFSSWIDLPLIWVD